MLKTLQDAGFKKAEKVNLSHYFSILIIPVMFVCAEEEYSSLSTTYLSFLCSTKSATSLRVHVECWVLVMFAVDVFVL